RTVYSEYERHSRCGQFIFTQNVTIRTGRIVAARAVKPDMELMVISESGIVMRTTVGSISQVGRAAQGVHIMNVGPGDHVACVACIDMSKPAPATTNGASSNGNSSNGSRPARRGRRR